MVPNLKTQNENILNYTVMTVCKDQTSWMQNGDSSALC